MSIAEKVVVPAVVLRIDAAQWWKGRIRGARRYLGRVSQRIQITPSGYDTVISGCINLGKLRHVGNAGVPRKINNKCGTV